MAGLNELQTEKELYDQVIENVTLPSPHIFCNEFQDCVFKNCDLNGASFSGKTLVDCRFENCNLSMMQTGGAAFNDVRFKNCKMLGVIFSDARDGLFSVSFDSCILDYCSFFGKKMTKANFIKCSLKEANFTQTNLTQANFSGSDLAGAIFHETLLSKADLSAAVNFIIDPELNDIRNASFSASEIAGLLTRHQIKIV